MENVPTAKLARGEAWKTYHKQRKDRGLEERPKISGPIPIPPKPLAEYAVPNGSQHSPQQEMPKSRTLGVLSSISQSLSRASLSRPNTRGRNVSGSSGSAVTPVPKQPRPFISRFGRKSLEPTLEIDTEWSELGYSPVPPLPIPNDPRAVSKEMPSQYWTGRFTSLHDQLESELLEPESLNVVMEGLIARSSLYGKPGNTSSPSARALNNPSTSVYAATRLPRHSLGSYHPNVNHGVDTNPRKSSHGIHHSATSNAILETARKSSVNRSRISPISYSRGVPQSLPTSRLPSYDQATAMPVPLHSDSLLNSFPDSPYDGDTLMESHDHSREMGRALAVANAEALTDENSRRMRVLVQLESFCMTDEARRSLYKWQQSFARHAKCEALLPPGGSMEERHRKAPGGLVSRLEGLLHRSDGKSLTVGKQRGQRPSLPQPAPAYTAKPRASYNGGQGALRGSKTGPDAGMGADKLKKASVFAIF